MIGVQSEIAMVNYFIEKNLSEEKGLEPPDLPDGATALGIASYERFDINKLQKEKARLQEEKVIIQKQMASLLGECSRIIFYLRSTTIKTRILLSSFIYF